MRIDIENVRSLLSDNYILVLTTNSTEKQAVNSLFETKADAVVVAETDGAYLGTLGGRFVLHLCGTSGAQKAKSISRICSRLLARPRFPRPALVMVCGIAWGNPEHLTVEDVLLSAEVSAINHRLEGPDGTTYRLESHVSPLPHAGEVLAGVADPSPRVFTGPIASGETHYGSTQSREALLSQHPSIMAGDMESFALVNHLPDHPWLIVRGVSDLGDDGTTRDHQRAAALRAAGQLVAVLASVSKKDAIPPARGDIGGTLLKAAIDGDAFFIGKDDHGDRDISWYLNDELAPGLVARLTRYSVAGHNNVDLPRDLGDLILETTQNALRHGGADSVSITFRETSVELRDNGRPYSLPALVGERGGAGAWTRLDEQYLKTGALDYSAPSCEGGNRYVFTFKGLDHALGTAREKCNAIIAKSWSRTEAVLEFDDACQQVFFDTRQLHMVTVRQASTPHFRRLLESGRSLYLSCWNERERAFYKAELAEFEGPRLHIFVGNAPGQ